ncbi:cobalt-zinc-cadmium efflux system membrane fusion protein [Dyadobacter sp. BE34]|uniref:Cobalt-zinc-cadmium efflux system membrane fusion protein n=1 Tax=Dyadobacter fermentans TaxID=94254 RepID=A0ABU1R6S0_9BACT|nr:MULTISPECIES: efflux RND transporter periplasmic adaptor subunit [Dyadobacter]MDR6808614.1 cobalt-zinc-cadmium efflux system membrane fusion protein [Dyadobacter fermentans]MDR7046357.1 cobalt-zinc-cadmium efflux system membrane fusion protein [Dyadobacter sp. BE242]MDR7200670.1 cobalt-zinc-cadmium efflux system membrane fusion protein [Dyadobacter sp. BE34]MDR7218630.1 cobalt-zinc-cadmium efflux system membrane fusion protein [Dyadobacter sp. BE31]MDR7266560.1 cobalt-zinc-cadmium efflux sy
MKNIALGLVLFLAIASCKPETEKEAAEAGAEHAAEESNHVVLTAAQYETAGVETGGFSVRKLSGTVAANGVIDIPPQNLVSISAPLGGFVRKSELLQGMKVQKGEVLAVIENPDFIPIQQDYLETRSKLEFAEQEYQRQNDLSKENVNAQKALQQSASELKVLRARLAGLKERVRTAGVDLAGLEKGNITSVASIRSPIAGSVTVVNVNLGKYVNPTDVMFEIVDTDHLHVELSVFEQDIPKVKLGQLVRFRVSNNPGQEDLAKVYLINQKINDDRTVRVHCHLEKEDNALLPQNFVKAIIETGANPVNALPDEAVVDFEGKSYVFVKDPKGERSFDMVEVTRGISENGFTEVKMPAGAGEIPQFVLKGAYTLLSKLKNSEEEEGH